MKHLTRLFIAVAITLLAAVVAVGVWAGPGRAGTVPTPIDGVGNCGSSAVSFGTGTFQVFGSDCKVIVKRSNAFGELPEGWSYLSEVLEVKLLDGVLSQVEICLPLNPDWSDKVAGQSINFFYWEAAKGAWVMIPTTIKIKETPPVVCGIGSSAGSYALFGK